MRVFENVPLSLYTTFRLGGPARYLIECYTVDDVRDAIKFALERNLPILPLGAGSDVLFSDKGFNGVVIRLMNLRGYKFVDNYAYIMAGEPLPKIANLTADMGLSGFEYLVGVPGTVGGGIAKNAGAHGHEMAEILEEVYVVSKEGEILTLSPKDINIRYRESDLLKFGIAVEGKFKLKYEDPKVIKERIREFTEYREKTQPWKTKTAGCMFKNPPGNYAGKLIEQAGLKGFRIGGVRVSEKHANFFENIGGTAEDALRLIDFVRKRVYEVFGIELEVEIVII
ncbi:MAG: UDP-N-acetylmuramate dehydrogenase [Candidatus Caldipriscus sp.]|nr:UDP-N-acetylmuramate dehydrogenase [Candidatus Caldipriscus sp.]